MLKQKGLPKTRVTTPRWALQRLEFYRTSSKLLDIHLPPLNSYSISVLKKELIYRIKLEHSERLAFFCISKPCFYKIAIFISNGDTIG